MLAAAHDAYVRGMETTGIAGAVLAVLVAAATAVLLRGAGLPGPPPAQDADAATEAGVPVKALEKVDD